ncbi:hypothetical protein [Pseudomonas sp. BR20]|uniref:hypothetical protein n=1 Tax=Pseudomonas sp. BR20 TaxID=3137452 RepID=UPI003D6DDADE
MEFNELIVFGALIASTLSAFCACWKFSRFVIEKNNPKAAERWRKTAAYAASDGNYTPSEIRHIEQSHYRPHFKTVCIWTVVFAITLLITLASATWL